jgi:hypothetical protein
MCLISSRGLDLSTRAFLLISLMLMTNYVIRVMRIKVRETKITSVELGLCLCSRLPGKIEDRQPDRSNTKTGSMMMCSYLCSTSTSVNRRYR